MMKGKPMDPEGVKESIRHVTGLVDKEIAGGIPANRIVVGGFSQGKYLVIIYLFLIFLEVACSAHPAEAPKMLASACLPACLVFGTVPPEIMASLGAVYLYGRRIGECRGCACMSYVQVGAVRIAVMIV